VCLGLRKAEPPPRSVCLFLVLSPQLLAGVVRARSSLPPFLDDSNFSLSTTEHRSTSMSTIITELVDLVTFLAQPKVLMIQWFLVPAMVVLINVLQQLVCPAFIVHRARTWSDHAQYWPRDKSLPPMVFHYFPWVGSTVSYGMDPYKFLFACREKVGLSGCFYRGLS